MDDRSYSEEYDDGEKKKFQLTRGMVILAAIILVAIIVIIIVLVSVKNNKKPEYTTEDFAKLESRMEEEAPTYLSQKNIELTGEETKIDLKDLLDKNGGSIDSSKVKAVNICDGYVIAKKIETEKYDAYIKCGDLYTTSGYVSNDSKEVKKTTTTKKDTEKPVITIIGESEITINQGSEYKDSGAKANDNIDGDLTSKIKTTSTVNVKNSGTYVVTYTVSDKAGNKAEAKRKVIVVATPTTTVRTTTKSSSNVKTTTRARVTVTTTQRVTTPPTITLRGSTVVEINAGTQYTDPGYSATDAKGTDITASVTVSGNINTNVAGTYTLRYSVTDSYGNSASKTRTIRVKSTYVALQGITLTPNTVSLSVGQSKTLSIYFNPTNATNKSVTWSSSNPSVSTISNGTITAKSKGTATITASGADGRKAYVSVTVK